jgi:hypothetical protein
MKWLVLWLEPGPEVGGRQSAVVAHLRTTSTRPDTVIAHGAQLERAGS